MRCGEVAACPQFCTDRRRRRCAGNRSPRAEGQISAASHTRIIKLKSNTAELDGKHVILKDIQRTPVSGESCTPTCTRWISTAPIRVEVPLKFIGKAKGVANGGILAPLERTATVECLPLEIPDSIEVDVTDVDIHDVIHVSAVKFPDKAKPISIPTIQWSPCCRRLSRKSRSSRLRNRSRALRSKALHRQKALRLPQRARPKRLARRTRVARSPRPPRKRSSCFSVSLARVEPSARASGFDVRGTGARLTSRVRCRGRGRYEFPSIFTSIRSTASSTAPTKSGRSSNTPRRRGWKRSR